jgi:hypothetical protein
VPGIKTVPPRDQNREDMERKVAPPSPFAHSRDAAEPIRWRSPHSPLARDFIFLSAVNAAPQRRAGVKIGVVPPVTSF